MSNVFTTKKSEKLVGTYISLEAAAHLGLTALLKEISRAQLLRSWIAGALNDEKSVQDAVSLLAAKVVERWKKQKQSDKSPFSAYCEKVRTELIRKRIDQRYITVILEKVGRLHAAQKTKQTP